MNGNLKWSMLVLWDGKQRRDENEFIENCIASNQARIRTVIQLNFILIKVLLFSLSHEKIFYSRKKQKKLNWLIFALPHAIVSFFQFNQFFSRFLWNEIFKKSSALRRICIGFMWASFDQFKPILHQQCKICLNLKFHTIDTKPHQMCVTEFRKLIQWTIFYLY